MSKEFPNVIDSVIPLIEQYAPSFCPKCIFDVGAFRGVVTDDLLHKYKQAQYHLFEPQQDWANHLVKKYSGISNIRINDYALYESQGEIEFNIGKFPPTSSIYERNAGKQYYNDGHTMIDVKKIMADTIDNYCHKRNITEIDLIKLDTQGSELSIFKGGLNMISRQKLHVIITEFFAIPHYEHAPLLCDTWSYLKSHGYDLYRMILGPHAKDGQLRYGDAIFLSRHFRENYLTTAA